MYCSPPKDAHREIHELIEIKGARYVNIAQNEALAAEYWFQLVDRIM
jgi:hypothetical protein